MPKPSVVLLVLVALPALGLFASAKIENVTNTVPRHSLTTFVYSFARLRR